MLFMHFKKMYALKYNNAFLFKDKSKIILYAVPISFWPMLGKENNRYFYTRHSNKNDR